MNNIKEKLKNLPLLPGVYIMKNKSGEIIYIGKAKNLLNRVRSYFREKLDRPKTQILMSHFDSLEYINYFSSTKYNRKNYWIKSQ